MALLKEGDLIEWSFEDAREIEIFGKTHQSEIAFVDLDDQAYCVYASYGQDKIAFDKATKIDKH